MTPAGAATPVQATIRRRSKAERSASFEALRAQGLALVQKTSGATWTDHNLHDPGITTLEQLCFALTELVYRAEFPVADHLCGADGEIDYEALALHPPEAAFPSRATTAADYRRLLLDRVSGLDDAGLLLDEEPDAASHITGVCQLMVKLAAGPHPLPEQRVQAALAAYRSQRGLGEDVDPDVVQIADQRCELHADIEISGPREATDIVAEVFLRAARSVAQSVRVRSRRELQQQGLVLEQIYDGPVVQRGFSVIDADDAQPRRMLYMADIVREIVGLKADGAAGADAGEGAAGGVDGVDGVKEVHHLRLETATEDGRNGALVWRGGGQMLRLHIPGAPALDDAPDRAGELLQHVTVRRRSHTVPVLAHELWRRVQELQAAEHAEQSRHSTLTQADERQSLPRGSHRPPAPYHSVQHHFPAVYHLGRHGLPAAAPAAQLAPPRQLRSYLLLFEQVIANGQAQLQHLHQLFRLPGPAQQTYWWQPLGEHNVPGLDGLCLRTPGQLESEVFAPLDASAARKSRRLDHLLALHGESYGQNAMRQFCGHLRAEELDTLLLANKTAWLQDIISLSRDRAGGFDYSQPLWDNPANTSGLARRSCLLLGLRYAHARSLTANLLKVRALCSGAVADLASAEAVDAAALQAGDAVAIGPAPTQRAEREAHLQALLRRAGTPLSAALLRCGVSSERYRLLPAGAHGTRLAVGPDEQQRGWHLGHFDTPAAATAAAATLRDYLLRVNDEAEGLHLVEHVLLRPLCARTATHQPPHDTLKLQPPYYALRLTAVLPDWTARTFHAGFRALAQDTLRMNCPSHLSLQLRWLGFEAMVRFEADYGAWLKERREHCKAPSEAQARRVDAAALRVITWLPAPPVPVADFSDVMDGLGRDG